MCIRNESGWLVGWLVDWPVVDRSIVIEVPIYDQTVTTLRARFVKTTVTFKLLNVEN